jgi:hypothetical protein
MEFKLTLTSSHVLHKFSKFQCDVNAFEGRLYNDSTSVQLLRLQASCLATQHYHSQTFVHLTHALASRQHLRPESNAYTVASMHLEPAAPVYKISRRGDSVRLHARTMSYWNQAQTLRTLVPQPPGAVPQSRRGNPCRQRCVACRYKFGESSHASCPQYFAQAACGMWTHGRNRLERARASKAMFPAGFGT